MPSTLFPFQTPFILIILVITIGCIVMGSPMCDYDIDACIRPIRIITAHDSPGERRARRNLCHAINILAPHRIYVPGTSFTVVINENGRSRSSAYIVLDADSGLFTSADGWTLFDQFVYEQCRCWAQKHLTENFTRYAEQTYPTVTPIDLVASFNALAYLDWVKRLVEPSGVEPSFPSLESPSETDKVVLANIDRLNAELPIFHLKMQIAVQQPITIDRDP